jgi:hypothetical protein
MPMPDPTGDSGEEFGFFNHRRMLAILTALVLVLLAAVAWLTYTVMQLKKEREKAGAQAPAAASSPWVASIEPASQRSTGCRHEHG